MSTDSIPELRQIAEEYRQQLLRGVADKSGLKVLSGDDLQEWLDQNSDLLLDIAQANSQGMVDTSELIEAYRKAVSSASTETLEDDPNARLILAHSIEEIEHACKDLGLEVQAGVVYGGNPTSGLMASQRSVSFTGGAASIVEVSIPFLPFCNLVSRMMTLTLAESEGEAWSQVPLSLKDRLPSKPDLVGDWSSLILSYAVNGFPPQHHVFGFANANQALTRLLLLKSMETFAIAHEYGHHVLRHGQSESTEDKADHLQDEHEADVFGHMISYKIWSNPQKVNPFAVTGVGAVLMLGLIDLVARAKNLLRTGLDQSPPRKRHPPFRERIDVISVASTRYMPEEVSRPAQIMRDAFMEIIELIWTQIKPSIIKMREEGARPNEDNVGPTDWLPVYIAER
ncbi:ImmA/IrrE family metallo-endopeptidase [Methylobacterium sp. A49B]